MGNSAAAICHNEYEIEHGGQDVVIFVHGILGSPRRFRFLAEELSARGFDCVALLLPGHGGTARQFYSTPIKSWPEYVKQRVREAARQHRRVYLVGHSLGGLISLDCAACGGIDGVILINTPLAYKINIKRLGFSFRMTHSTPDTDDPKLAAHREDMSVSGAKILEYPMWIKPYIGLYRYTQRTRRRLKDVHSRALIVQSANDESVRQESAEILREGLVNTQARVLKLKESSHGYFSEEDRKRLLRAVTGFIDTD